MKPNKAVPTDLDELIPLLIHMYRRFRNIPGPPDRLQTREFRVVVENVKSMVSMTHKGKSLIGQDYFNDPDLLASYLLYQWIIHYQQGLSILGELPHTPRRVLDVCSGPAPFAFAALRHGARDVTAVDRSMQALQLGAEVSGRYGMPMAIRRWDCKKQELPEEGNFDLIILGHCLLELFPEKEQQPAMQKFVGDLLKRLTPQGFLVIVDNSFVEANKRILQLRDTLVEQGVPVQAPCVWKGPCPVLSLPNSPCYAQRELEKPVLVREIQRAASINLSSLKMTYLIMRSPQAQWPDLDGERLYRVISPPVESFHGKRYYLCGVDGKKSLGSRFETQPKEARAFDYLRRGELIRIEDPLESPNTLDIIEGTKVDVKAACGKPLIEKMESDL